jgi:hypothetical protein
MEQILQNFGLRLEMNVVSYNPRHNPPILELLGKEKYSDILTKQDVIAVLRSCTLSCRLLSLSNCIASSRYISTFSFSLFIYLTLPSEWMCNFVRA